MHDITGTCFFCWWPEFTIVRYVLKLWRAWVKWRYIYFWFSHILWVYLTRKTCGQHWFTSLNIWDTLRSAEGNYTIYTYVPDIFIYSLKGQISQFSPPCFFFQIAAKRVWITDKCYVLVVAAELFAIIMHRKKDRGLCLQSAKRPMKYRTVT